MRKTRTILFAGSTLAGLAACSALPSESQQATASDAEYHASGGGFVGSGHKETAGTASVPTALDTTTQRGGHGFGSGN